VAARNLLDSNILIAALKGEHAALLNRLATLAPSRICLSSIVLAELMTGAHKSRNPASNEVALEEITRNMEAVPFDHEAALVYGKLRAELESKGQIVGPHDLLIAAQALSRDLVLVTANPREFKRVPGLHCENWMK
jgi:tRNA(fMet)-specific endonuclease VapC